jgi:hypothetical protein
LSSDRRDALDCHLLGAAVTCPRVLDSPAEAIESGVIEVTIVVANAAMMERNEVRFNMGLSRKPFLSGTLEHPPSFHSDGQHKKALFNGAHLQRLVGI